MENQQDAGAWRTHALSAMGYVGVWQADFTTHRIRGDGELSRIFGVAPDKLCQGISIDALDHIYFGHDLEVVKSSRRAIVPMGGHARYEFRMRNLHGDGCRWIRSLAQVDVDRDGRMRQVSGALFDLTAQAPPQGPGVYLAADGETPPGTSLGPLPVEDLDRLSGQLIQASRGARALGLLGIETDLRRALAQVGALLSHRFRATTSH